MWSLLTRSWAYLRQALAPQPVSAGTTARSTNPLQVKRATMAFLYVSILLASVTIVVFAFAPAQVVFTWRYIRGSLSVASLGLLIAGAALLGGTILGFLFGIPRTLQAPDDKARYQVNTNLEQISDWLTKIIVGVTLVQLRDLPGLMMTVNEYLAPALGGGRRGETFAGAIILHFLIAGFLLGYLGTRLYVAGAIVEADKALEIEKLAVAATDQLFSPAAEALRSGDQPGNLPPVAQELKRVADEHQPLAGDLSVATARALALTYFLNGEYGRATTFFDRANIDPVADPEFTMQHAIALGEVGRHDRGTELLMHLVTANKGIPKAYKLLGESLLHLPGRGQESADYTQQYLDAAGPDAQALFTLAAANAQIYKDTKNDVLAQKALAALGEAVRMDSRLRDRARLLRSTALASLPEEGFNNALQEP